MVRQNANNLSHVTSGNGKGDWSIGWVVERKERPINLGHLNVPHGIADGGDRSVIERFDPLYDANYDVRLMTTEMAGLV
jgi:hypothetical protein